MKEDIINFVKGFHSKEILSKAITSSFLTLITNIPHPINLEDYRPICLVGFLFKIVVKLLVVRLKNVLGGLISQCQSAFILGRKLLGGVLVANEIVDTKLEI